jgi:two-component system NtrC family response regulator
MHETILLIDDDKNLLRVTQYNLASAGFEVVTATSGRAGLERFEAEGPDLVITDVKLGDMSGIDVLKAIKARDSRVPVIVFTAFGTIKMAVEAMRRGAFNFITKPFDRETLRLTCKKALELNRLRSRNQMLSAEVDRLTGTKGIATVNSAMQELLDTALKVADSEATVLVSGESGTGKEVLARLIHKKSQRKDGPLVAVNCSAIPDNLMESELFGHVKGAFTGAIANRKGRFQRASGGTLFLDEVGELKANMQAKLLRAIQERVVEPVGAEKQQPVDIRIVAATNKDLKKAVSEGGFREDLFYRLSVIPLNIPPLRERREDIPSLTRHFLKLFNAPGAVRFSNRALQAMAIYHWPGNIRELQNTVERCLILRKSDRIGRDDLDLPCDTGLAGGSLPELPEEGLSLEELERDMIIKALKKSRGNRSEAARLLKTPRHVLIYRIEKYQLKTEEYSSGR